jgi:hypothetical protein
MSSPTREKWWEKETQQERLQETHLLPEAQFRHHHKPPS